MELEADLSYVMPAALLTELTALARTTGCKEQPDKSSYNVRSFVNFIPGLGFVYRMTVRHISSVSDENHASFSRLN